MCAPGNLTGKPATPPNPAPDLKRPPQLEDRGRSHEVRAPAPGPRQISRADTQLPSRIQLTIIAGWLNCGAFVSTMPGPFLRSSGAVLGRVNLVDVADGSAELGYRIAEKSAGQGLATAAVREICARAAAEYGLTALRAVTTLDNAGSRAVLARTGFIPTGEVRLSGRPDLRFVRYLGEVLDGSAP